MAQNTGCGQQRSVQKLHEVTPQDFIGVKIKDNGLDTGWG